MFHFIPPLFKRYLPLSNDEMQQLRSTVYNSCELLYYCMVSPYDIWVEYLYGFLISVSALPFSN